MSLDFNVFKKENLEKFTSARIGEEKAGEFFSFGTNYSKNEIEFVLVGVPESFGCQINKGNPGAENAFDAFLSYFCNIQNNAFFPASKICIYGEVDFSKLNTSEKSDTTSINSALDNSALVNELDDFLAKVIQPIFDLNKRVILIGGGHNNAFPLIKALSLSTKKTVSILNVDPHADFRLLEGRHSGNSFSYAMNEGFLERYAVLGLHQNYNSQEMLTRMTENEVKFTFFEQYMDGERNFDADLNAMITWMRKTPIGIELDMDAISEMPSSAFTPSGMSLEEARRYVRMCAKVRDVQYLHLPEAAPTNAQESKKVGKALAYLVSDFIKCSPNAN